MRHKTKFLWSCPLTVISNGWVHKERDRQFWLKFQDAFTQKGHLNWTHGVNEMLMDSLNFLFFLFFPGWFQQNQNWWGQPTCNKDAGEWLNVPTCVPFQMQVSTFMLFSWYYLVGLHTYTHPSTFIVHVVLCHPSASRKYCVFCSFWVSVFPKVVYSGHLVALTPNVRRLGFHFSFSLLSGVCWMTTIRNAQCAVDSFKTEYCSCTTVTFHRATATVLSLGVRLWNSQNLLSFGSSWLSSVFMISWLDKCGIT